MHKTAAILYIDPMVHYRLPTAEQTDGSRRPYICEMKQYFNTDLLKVPQYLSKIKTQILVEQTARMNDKPDRKHSVYNNPDISAKMY